MRSFMSLSNNNLPLLNAPFFAQHTCLALPCQQRSPNHCKKQEQMTPVRAVYKKALYQYANDARVGSNMDGINILRVLKIARALPYG